MNHLHLDVQQEYAKWDNIHARMKNTPPTEGNDYIKHAVNLLSILEPIAEIHPIAKVVVGSFKQLVLFEQDRRENDARVAGVILAQTDMMRVLLDIDDLRNRRGDASALRAMVELPQLLHQIQERIAACHNSIDTYYKEHRLVKLYKSKDWKDRMLGFIEAFDKYRVLLHQALSLQMASGVNDLVSKMDIMLSRLFTPKDSWEKDVMAKIQYLQNENEWMNDPATLRSLAIATGDTSLNFEDNPSDLLARAKNGMQLDQLKEDLHLPLDTLCERNLELFELKLRLHTERLEKAIMHSARLVIRTLSGPHDRLEHEDLRQLWKEMNWIFCVETKIFSIAIFEYYLDLYSTPYNQKNTTDAVVNDEQGFWMPKLNSVARFKSGSLNHPQAWTLQYLSLFATKIATAIDNDNSGFIRISEANAFTSQIPEGWTLPEWCAYLVAGQFHENSIYRKRITHLRNKIDEMQAQVLPANRLGAAEIPFGISATLLHYISLEPRTQSNNSTIAPELHDLVKTKILAQDAKLRAQVDSIKWSIEDNSTIRVLSEGKPLELYIFPLCYILMELMLDLHHLCCSVTLDLKEWIAVYRPYLALRAMAELHIKDLKQIFETDKTSTEDIDTYHGGIWHLLEKTHSHDLSEIRSGFETDLVPVNIQDISDYYSDLSFLEEFPLPRLTGSLLSRKYSTWEEFVKSHDTSEIPSIIPATWNPIDDELNRFQNMFLDLPLSGWFCDKCSKQASDNERRFHCLKCRDFDLCKACYDLPAADHAIENHNFNHTIVFSAAWIQSVRSAWIAFRADRAIETLREKFRNVPTTRGSSIANDDPITDEKPDETSKVVDTGFVCGRCATHIILGSRFYLCVEYSCTDFYLCDKCPLERDIPDGTNHFWWHGLLLFDNRTLQIGQAEEPPSVDSDIKQTPVKGEPDSEHLPEIGLDRRFSDVVDSMASFATKMEGMGDVIRGSLGGISKMENTIAGLELKMDERMVGLESKMEERIAGLELKMEEMFAELRRGLSALLSTQP